MSISNFGQESMPGLAWPGAVAKPVGIGANIQPLSEKSSPVRILLFTTEGERG